MPSESMDFSQRAHLTEWMDEPCSYAEFRDCLRDLEQVNRLLGGYKPTLDWVAAYLEKHTGPAHLLDAGSGGGGMLRALEAWAAKHHRTVKLTGIDLNPHAEPAAREFSPAGSRIEWLTGDVFEYRDDGGVDLIVSSLVTHHLTEEEIVRLLAWMEATATGGWFINDLRRSAKSFHTFRVLAWAMRWHRFVRHDGPVSVRRSFLPEDWRRMCTAAGLRNEDFTIEGKPFGRLCVSRLKR